MKKPEPVCRCNTGLYCRLHLRYGWDKAEKVQIAKRQQKTGKGKKGVGSFEH